MMPSVYPVARSWPGALFLSSRPRGGEWLEDEVAAWRRYDIDVVVSLLTEEEERELDLLDEGTETRKQGLAYVSYPIPDRGVPSNTTTMFHLLETIYRDLQKGRKVLIHCRQGIGRTGLIASSLLVRDGMEPQSAIQAVSKARGVQTPETPEQEACIYEVAANVR